MRIDLRLGVRHATRSSLSAILLLQIEKLLVHSLLPKLLWHQFS